MAGEHGLDSWDVLTDPSDPGLHWTTGNIGEAVPGVQTPVGHHHRGGHAAEHA
jgi:hypothetical protein